MRWTRVIPHLGFVVLLAVLLVLTRGMTGSILPASGIGSAWFYTGFLLLLFAMFYVEPHYGAPRNVMTHCLAGIVALLSVRGSLSGHAAIEHWSWWVLAYCCLFLAVSWLAINLSDPEQSLNYWGNKAGEVLKESAVTFGSARVIYSLLFLLLLPAAPSFNSSWATATMVFWWLVVMVVSSPIA